MNIFPQNVKFRYQGEQEGQLINTAVTHLYESEQQQEIKILFTKKLRSEFGCLLIQICITVAY